MPLLVYRRLHLDGAWTPARRLVAKLLLGRKEADGERTAHAVRSPASGAHPSHSGWLAVASKGLDVLNSSYFPSAAASAVFLSSAAVCSSVSGSNVLTTSRWCLRTSMLSMPAMTTDV